MCEYCDTPDSLGDYEPCCNQGPCTAIPEIGMCECCGAEMFEEKGFWFHYSQIDIPYEERTPQNEKLTK